MSQLWGQSAVIQETGVWRVLEPPFDYSVLQKFHYVLLNIVM